MAEYETLSARIAADLVGQVRTYGKQHRLSISEMVRLGLLSVLAGTAGESAATEYTPGLTEQVQAMQQALEALTARVDALAHVVYPTFNTSQTHSESIGEYEAFAESITQDNMCNNDMTSQTSDNNNITCNTDRDEPPQPVALTSTDDPTPAPEHSPDPKPTIEGTDIPYAAFDPSKHYLDKPCHKVGHASHREAGNMYYISGKQCWACKTLRNRARKTVKAS